MEFWRCQQRYHQYTANLCQGAAQYTVANTGFGDYTFTATNLSSLPGATTLWNFGDGTSSTSATATHHYIAGGNFPLSLIVTDAAFSCADTSGNTNLNDSLSGNNFAVTLCSYPLAIDTSVLSYNPINIQFQPSPQNAGYTYAWTFGDGGTGTGQTVSHIFVASGTYNTAVTIADAGTGCSYTISSAFNLNLCGLNAGFGNSGNGDTQSFYAYNYDSVNNVGNVASYAWSFPGAIPSTGSGSEVDNVVYPSVGIYSACVYLTTTGGCIDTLCQQVIITTPTYSITGTITKSGGSGFVGTVYLIVQDSVGHLALLDSVNSQIDTAGNGFSYSFYNLPVDTYFVKAALVSTDPDYANYLPTYYNNALTWGIAMPVTLPGNNTIDIALIAGSNSGGPGFVGGYVSQGAGLVLGGAGNNNAKSLGDPLQNIQINLLTSTNQPVAYTYTDANGKYSFPNLALGSYTIYAEQLNKIPSPLEFTLTAENPADSGANISINSHSATGINNINGLQVTSVYPNPVIGTVQLQISCIQNFDASVKLVDVLGRTALEQTLKLAGGQNTAQLNMEQLASGVYQLVIQSGGNQITYKLVKAK